MTTGLNNKQVTTKKPHLCFSCHRIFPVGTNMEYWSSIYEDNFCSGYTCQTCIEIIKLDDDTSEGIPDGYVNDWLDKNETPEDLLVRLKNKKNG